MADKQNISNDEVAVRDLIEAWADSVRRKDYDGILRSHAADFVMFDVPPPFKSVGLDAYRKTWDLFFSWSSDPIPFEILEMDITAGADVAFAFATMRCEGPGVDGKPEALDFRLTIVLRKIDAQWMIAHEHHSVPAID
jgi:ketosteroid isomerase-like protein